MWNAEEKGAKLAPRLRLRSSVIEVDIGTVMLLFDAWHVNTDSKWCLANDCSTTVLVVTSSLYSNVSSSSV